MTVDPHIISALKPGDILVLDSNAFPWDDDGAIDERTQEISLLVGHKDFMMIYVPDANLSLLDHESAIQILQDIAAHDEAAAKS